MTKTFFFAFWLAFASPVANVATSLATEEDNIFNAPTSSSSVSHQSYSSTKYIKSINLDTHQLNTIKTHRQLPISLRGKTPDNRIIPPQGKLARHRTQNGHRLHHGPIEIIMPANLPPTGSPQPTSYKVDIIPPNEGSPPTTGGTTPSASPSASTNSTQAGDGSSSNGEGQPSGDDGLSFGFDDDSDGGGLPSDGGGLPSDGGGLPSDGGGLPSDGGGLPSDLQRTSSTSSYSYGNGACPNAGRTGLSCPPDDLAIMCDSYSSRGSFEKCLEACKPSYCCTYTGKTNNNVAGSCREDENCPLYAYCYIVWSKIHDTIGPATYLRVEKEAGGSFFDIGSDDVFGTEVDDFYKQFLFHHFDNVDDIIDDGTVRSSDDDGRHFEPARIFENPDYWPDAMKGGESGGVWYDEDRR